MFLVVFLCIVLLSPCVLSSIENCTATKCLRCIPKVTPICTVSQIDQWRYNVYCEPPSNSSNCQERNFTDLNSERFCFVIVDRDNDNGQWTYLASNFQYQDQHTNCSNVDGNPVLPNCLHLYSEVTAVEEIGQNVFCRCYEDDCQKRINITFRVTENISSVSSSLLLSPTSISITTNDDTTPSLLVTTSSISTNDDRTPSLVSTSSISTNDDRTPSLTTSSSLGRGTLISQSLQASLSIVSISTSVYSNGLPSNIPNTHNSLEGPLNSK